MYDTLNYTIGHTIADLLESQGKKQKDLAKYLDVNSNVVSYWCNGTRKPNIEQIIQIAKYFNVTTDYLLGVSRNKTTDIELAAVSEYVKLKDETVKTLHSGCSFAPSFLDFALNSDNRDLFSDVCENFLDYCRAVSNLIIYRLDFLCEPLPPINTETDIFRIINKKKQIEEKIDLEEYRTEKMFIKLLSQYKEQTISKEKEEEFYKKWDKLIIKYDRKFRK